MVLKGAISIAKIWLQCLEDAEKDTTEPQKYMKTFNKEIIKCETQLELVKAGLRGDKELSRLRSKPSELIHRLYR